MSSSKKIWIPLVSLLLLAGVSAGYYFFHQFTLERQTQSPSQQPLGSEPEDFFTLRLYYPENNRLEPMEKRVAGRTRQRAIADAVIEEYFKGPGNGAVSPIPRDVKLLGLYEDSSHILYVDLSDEIRRNFQGDALAEYLLLKGLYESLISNLQDVQDIKVLVEGKEADSLGGHFYLKYPLKNIVAYDFTGDEKLTDAEKQ